MEAGLIRLVLHLHEATVRLLVLERAAVHRDLHRLLLAVLVGDGQLLDEDALLTLDAVPGLVTERRCSGVRSCVMRDVQCRC